MSKKPISIPQPCPANYKAMPKCEKGLYCSGCQKHVLDLRHKPQDEVHAILEQHETACIVIDAHHLQKKPWPVVEKTAAFLRKNKLARVAAMLIAFSLFLSSCARRTVCGAMWKQQPGDHAETLPADHTKTPEHHE